ncbi:Uncharacterised protein [Escherichia coli]|uniref:Uncharacterized protein n=1 Tax=Escherichia coli TaxID=562 RepID=A0A376U405_ECOLX|nr:Uncharacterised protein [Escherichia coli]
MSNIDNKGWGFPALSKKAHFFNSGKPYHYAENGCS